MKTVLIIGGSSGIGKECVKLFHKKKWKVFSTYFSNIQKSSKKNIHWSFFDIHNPYNLVIKNFQKFDAVIICAGKNKTQNLSELNKNDFEDILQVNLFGQLNVIRRIRSNMKKGSSLILFGSTVPRVGFKRRIAYGVSKGAIEGVTKTLASELAPNIRVNCILPGYINTGLFLKNNTLDISERIKKILLRRIGEPEEVAQLVYFLADSASSYINGESININGGLNYE
jgi:NAD(P)-dependent dehydrogenase (short-subunit alcohol dehydrogenase family)